MKTFYITTTLPYVNAEPHIGFALEIVKADVIARWHRLKGEEVFFNTGVDEHGLKIYRKAEELGLSPQAYCDQMAAKFSNLKTALNLSYDNFIRTTDEAHIKAAQEFWRRAVKAGDIYKKNYQVKYCVGCELEKTESELVDDRCPLHPNQDLELIDEENYFFRFSAYQEKLLKFYEARPDFVMPESKLNEIKKFTERGLADFSISRLKSKMPWGVSVPDDDEQVMYVWFDALINYISCLGWPEGDNFKKYWPGLQICGKDNLRQQAAMWQAMLLSVDLPNSRQILVNGFVTAEGQKMSKSLGNVIDPLTLVAKYGTDAVRYYLLAEMNPFEDSDFSQAKFHARYTADLVNGLGNLAARVATLLAKNSLALNLSATVRPDLQAEVEKQMKNYQFNAALFRIWQELSAADEAISHSQPWQLKEPAALAMALTPAAQTLYDAAALLEPFLPETAEKIRSNFGSAKISKGEPLFPRLVA